MTKVRIRKDLVKDGLAVPTSSGVYITEDKVYDGKWTDDNRLFVYANEVWLEVESIDFEEVTND
jgi:hypothetical protein